MRKRGWEFTERRRRCLLDSHDEEVEFKTSSAHLLRDKKLQLISGLFKY